MVRLPKFLLPIGRPSRPPSAAASRLSGSCLCTSRRAGEDNRDARAVPGARFDLKACLGIRPQRLDNQRAELPTLGPLDAVGKPNAVISDNDAATIAIRKALQCDRAAVTAGKRMLECVGQQF